MDNLEREQRILDTAVDLFVHYGFDKTTVSDIAREAGISKGAIYLHFKSKDELLERLILRELTLYGERWLVRLEDDPNGGTISALYKNSLYALNDSPFMAAMFKKDGRILGNYLRKPDNFFQRMREQQEHSDRYLFVKMMQDAGAIRTDVDAKVIAHVMNMIAYGLVGLDGVIPEQDIPPVDETIEGVALLMEKALTPENGGNPNAAREIIQKIASASRQTLQEQKS